MSISQNSRSVKFVVKLLISSFISIKSLACAQLVSGSAFDWDDNIMFMPTQVQLFHKHSNKIILISTSEYAKHNLEVGRTGKYQDYEIRVSETENTYKYFRDPIDNASESYFINDLKKVVQSNDTNWRGPSWNKFVEALNNEEVAEWTSIITARGHSPQTIFQGLEYLKSQGLIKYLPKIENIHPVSHPNYRSLAPTISEIKTKVMMDTLDKISSCKCNSNSKSSSKQSHVWGFSDDDYENYLSAEKILSKEIANGRWSNIKVSLFYTGDLMNVKRKLRYANYENFTTPFGLMGFVNNYI